MRPILCAVLVAGILLIVGGYHQFQEQVRRRYASGQPVTQASRERLEIEVLATCQLKSDRFADPADGSAIHIKLDGGAWTRTFETWDAGRPCLATLDHALRVGPHELFVRLSPAPGVPGPQAARVTVRRDLQIVGQGTLFREQDGNELAGVIPFEITGAASPGSEHP